MNNELDFFNEFVNKFDLMIPQIMMKKEHSCRVALNARLLANFLNLSEEDSNIAYISGLFHDLGRFVQYSTYKTFDDNKSIDHGDLSYEILKSIGYNKKEVLNAVKYHNKYEIPNNLDNRNKLFCKILRDADKFDILNDDFNLKYKNQKIDTKLIKYFKEKKLIPNGLIDNDLSIELGILSYIFDINFVETLNLIRNKKIINDKISKIYEETKDENIFIIEYFINKYIEERTGVKKYGRVR